MAAHAFDTQLTKPQRTTVRDAVVDRLRTGARLGYLQDVVAVGGIVVAGTPEEVGIISEEAGSKSPLALVALGQKSYESRGETSSADMWISELEVLVYAWSKNQRSRLARVAGDVVSTQSLDADPGCEVMLEHFEELLIGYKPAPRSNPTIYRLSPTGENEIELGSDFALWRQSYRVRLVREVERHRGAHVPITTIHARHHVDGAEQQNPIVETETQIS